MNIFTDNPDFYPTPNSVIEQMMLGEDFAGKTILEPSAGKGNIVDWLKENMAGRVIACENDPNIRKLLNGKCEVIADDFLAVTADRVSHIDYIVMNLPHNTRPVGYESTHCDGYVYIKVEEEKKMRPKHRHNCEQHNGPVPKGMCIAFRDDNRQNCDISNLMLITRAENMTRIKVSLTSEQNRMRIAKGQNTRNESIRKDKMRIRWGLEPKGKLVKKWYAPDK